MEDTGPCDANEIPSDVPVFARNRILFLFHSIPVSQTTRPIVMQSLYQCSSPRQLNCSPIFQSQGCSPVAPRVRNVLNVVADI